MVLMGTFEQGHASSMQLSIAVDFLIQRYLHFGAATTKYTSSRVSTLLDVMEPLQRLAGPGQLQLSQRSIYLLSHALPSISACNSFLNLAQQQKILLPRTVSLAAYNLGRIGWVGEALSLVQLLEPGSIKKAGKHSGFLGLWTTLLKMVPQAKGARATELAILRTMWDTASIKPNFGHHTVLIENALKRDEYETAWLLLDSLDKSASNAALLKIYSILLNAAKHKLDIARVKAIAERVHELNTPNAYIINDILHGILVINRRPHEAYEKGLLLDTRSPFLQMLPIFERHFYRPSLRRLTAGLWAYPLEEKTLTSTDALAEQRLVPTVHTLTIMIEALLHGARNLHVSRKFYSQFKSLLAENDPAALSIGSSVQFYNSLLKNFAQFDGSLKDCTAILGDMLAAQNSNTSLENTTKQKPSTSLSDSFDPNISWNANSNVKKTTSWRCPKPSVHTYTIVMAKYMKVKCPRSAENVLTLMHNHSVKPSLVTWLHLIDGYVKLQDPVMAANAYQRMRAAGISPDATITHILATLRDRETYLATLERLEKEKLPL